MSYSALFLMLLTLTFTACGSNLPDGFDDQSQGFEDSSPISENGDISNLDNPFNGLETGDDFHWGTFIRPPYRTVSITELPLQIYAPFFTEEEKDIIQEGIDIANDAIGFDVFELTDEWTPQARVIYKVHSIYFTESEFDDSGSGMIIGYTYSRNVYIDGKYDAGRIVTDWGMEVEDNHLSKWVIAHELGHAMGIQKHGLINYKKDRVEDLEENSLMAAHISANPVLGDYNYMMHQQGEILLNYIDNQDNSIALRGR